MRAAWAVTVAEVLQDLIACFILLVITPLVKTGNNFYVAVCLFVLLIAAVIYFGE